ADYVKRRAPPICYYGGMPYEQVVRRITDVVRHKSEDVRLGHEVVLCKLHGSLNWAHEHEAFKQFKIHEDLHAATRTSLKSGVVAIIPPIAEKTIKGFEWLHPVWDRAEEELRKAQ